MQASRFVKEPSVLVVLTLQKFESPLVGFDEVRWLRVSSEPGRVCVRVYDTDGVY